MIKILLVDDESEAVLSLSRALKSIDPAFTIEGASSVAKARELIEQSDPHVAVIDLSLNVKDGIEAGFDLLKSIINLGNRCKVIVLTGHCCVENGVRALTLGASHFLEKPPDLTLLAALISDCHRQSEIFRAYQKNHQSAGFLLLDRELIGSSKVSAQLREEIIFAASTNQSVLLVGETGTGKTLCASLIHQLSNRNKKKFICYTPAYHNADLVNSDLFGHLKGSFTGALETRSGLIKEAEQGTLFLDEIDELPKDTQISLLRVIQNRSFRAVGSNKEERVDFRLITATNCDFNLLVQSQKLREDFYHRIAHKIIHLPALRDRINDIAELSEAFLNSLRKREQLQIFALSDSALDKLQSASWPGNVRQLEAVLEGAAYYAQFRGRSEIVADDIQIEQRVGSQIVPENFHQAVEQFKTSLVMDAMQRYGGNQVQAAKSLGLGRSGLRRILGKE